MEWPNRAPARDGLVVPRRVAAVVIGGAIAIVIAGMALVLATSDRSQRVAANARELHWTNSAIGSAAIVRAATAQAVFFAVDAAIGVAGEEAADRAVAEAAAAVANLRSVAEVEYAHTDAAVAEALERFLHEAGQVQDLIAEGRVEDALAANQLQFEPAHTALSVVLTDLQHQIEERIDNHEGAAGRIATLTQIAVTLLIPIAAIAVYRAIVQRQVRERRITLEAKLRAEQDLNKAKDEFIAGLSHEFRTPLTSIYGFSEVLIESGLVDPNASLELIRLINSESAELSRMVEDLLVAARIEAEALTVKPLCVDPADEVELVIAPWLRVGRTFDIDVAPDRVWADPLRLRQVLRNLVANSIKHGGANVGIVGRRVGDRYALIVVDDGEGVASEIRDRLFERFVHDGRQALLTGSIGLGLNIARSLAERMDGDLTYEHSDGVTTFTVRLPLAFGRSLPAQPAEEVA